MIEIYADGSALVVKIKDEATGTMETERLTPAAALELAARLKSAAEGLLPKPPRACGQCDGGLVVGFEGMKRCPRCNGTGRAPEGGYEERRSP